MNGYSSKTSCLVCDLLLVQSSLHKRAMDLSSSSMALNLTAVAASVLALLACLSVILILGVWLKTYQGEVIVHGLPCIYWSIIVEEY